MEKWTGDEVERVKERASLLEIARLAYEIHEHGDGGKERDQLRPLLRRFGYKFDPVYDDD